MLVWLLLCSPTDEKAVFDVECLIIFPAGIVFERGVRSCFVKSDETCFDVWIDIFVLFVSGVAYCSAGVIGIFEGSWIFSPL